MGVELPSPASVSCAGRFGPCDGIGGGGYGVGMCASYGLEVEPGDAGFPVFDDHVPAAEIAEWVGTFGREPILPTGRNLRNLAPIIRDRGEGPRAEFAWWHIWVGGQPAKFAGINAKVENLLTGVWAGPTKKRRALVPATYWLEKKRRHDIGGEVLTFAAVSAVTKFEGDWLVSFAIVTRPATEELAEVHDRMPLIVPAGFRGEWLDPNREGDDELVRATLAASEPVSHAVQVEPAVQA